MKEAERRIKCGVGDKIRNRLTWTDNFNAQPCPQRLLLHPPPAPAPAPSPIRYSPVSDALGHARLNRFLSRIGASMIFRCVRALICSSPIPFRADSDPPTSRPSLTVSEQALTLSTDCLSLPFPMFISLRLARPNRSPGFSCADGRLDPAQTCLCRQYMET
jgi:hypothetical protein